MQRGWNHRYIGCLLFTLFCCVSLIGLHCSAQYEQIVFDHVNTQHGLSQSTVNYILQDRNGFLWFATYNGLNKYDGYSFKVYRKDVNDKSSLSSNDIVNIFEDNKGDLWITNLSTGLDRFDPETETFENFSHDPDDPGSLSSNDIFYITQDTKGSVWVCAGNALNRFVSSEDNPAGRNYFEQYRNPGSSALIRCVFETRDGRLFIFSNDLCYFDATNKRIVNTGITLENTVITSLVKDSNDNVLIGTILNGIIRLEYNSLNGTYRRTDPGIINVSPANRNYLFMDHNDHLWIGTELEGLYRYRPEANVLDHFLPDDMDSRTINDRTIYSIYEDNTGVLWIGTFSQGLNKYDFYRKQFLHFRKIPYKKNSLSGDVISSIHGINPKELWVGIDVGGGVNRLLFSGDQEPKIIRYMYDPDDPNTIGGNSTLCLVQRKNGEVWVGSGGGVISRIRPEPAFSGRKPDIKRYQFDRWTFAIYEDSEGILWGGTWERGLWRYDDNTDQFDFFLPDTSNRYSLSDNIIWSIGEDQHKNIWIGGHGNGINILTADEKRNSSPKFIHFKHKVNHPGSLSNNTISAFCQAQDGTFWICTHGGLNKVLNSDEITATFNDFPQLTFESYHIANGLPSEGIVGIAEDNDNTIWVSTTNGLSKFDPRSGKFVNYYENHGLQSNEFWHNAYFKDANGMIYFGGKNGFNAFYPGKIIPNPFLPELALTELKLFNKTVTVGDTVNGQVVLKAPIHKTGEILLSYKNNIITLQFAALHYAQPSQNNYAYYLEGFEHDWNYSGNRRSATYTNLDPGEYIFRVKASNNDGIWSEKEIALKIIITPPWWKSLFVKISAPIILILMAIGIFRIRLSILEQQKKVLQQTVVKRTGELQELNTLLEERQEEILIQNEELLRHRNNLEEMIKERTFELEHAKQKAEESDRLKSSFLANMSHEIRTPMNAILGFSNLLNDKEFDDTEKANFIRMINSNGEALMVLINDILDISMIESDQLVLTPQYFDVNTVLLELEEYCRLKNEHGLAIDFINKKEERLMLNVDPVRFRQIISNLLSNAMKYTHEGYIRFGYERRDHEIQFFVSDSGIGIDPAYSTSIFEHFFKIDPGPDQLYRGTGIGLAICKRLVEVLNGKIFLESIPGSGSTFYFTIPYESNADTVVKEKQAGKPGSHISLDTLFFVFAEDEPANYMVLTKMLHISDAKHFWAKNGKEVVDFIANLHRYDNIIVLMDIKMPEMNGYEALKEIKKINTDIPVIAVTAFAMKHDRDDILNKGFDDYLAKPVTPKKLKEIISRFINNPA